MDEIYTRPGYLFRRMQQIAVSIFLEECDPLDLTPVQYASLVAIRAIPGIDVTRLSAVIAFDRSTLGGVIERLETKGYIRREPTPEDKRIKLLHITEKGALLLNDVTAAVDRAQERMLQPLDAAERETLLALMTRLTEHSNETSRVPLRADEVVARLKKAATR